MSASQAHEKAATMLANAHIGQASDHNADGDFDGLILVNPNSVLIAGGYAMKKSTTAEGAENFCKAMASLQQAPDMSALNCSTYVFTMQDGKLVKSGESTCRAISDLASQQKGEDQLVGVIASLTIYVTVCEMPADLHGASEEAYGCAAHVIQVFSTLGCGQATAVWAKPSDPAAEGASAYGALEAEAEAEAFDDAASESSDLYAATDISDLTNFTRRSLYVFN